MKALILDFDGLVLDTETTAFESWRRVYADHGVELPREEWVRAIGTHDRAFDPVARLAELSGRPAHEEVQAGRRALRDQLVAALEPLPGVVEWLEAARARGMAAAIASSSPRSWVEGHLERIGLLHHFQDLVTGERVEWVKPDPALYELALASLGVGPGEAIALEDSPHGVAAARAAGVPCVAVPGPMTCDGDFRGATLVLRSLVERSLDDVLLALGAARDS